METTIRINTDNISVDIIDSIKKLFPHKVVEITIQQADATEYIPDDPEYTQDLMERIAEYEAKKTTISIKAEELL